MMVSGEENKAGPGLAGGDEEGLLLGQRWTRGMKEAREELGQFLRGGCLIPRSEQGQRL